MKEINRIYLRLNSKKIINNHLVDIVFINKSKEDLKVYGSAATKAFFPIDFALAEKFLELDLLQTEFLITNIYKTKTAARVLEKDFQKINLSEELQEVVNEWKIGSIWVAF